MFVKLFLLVLFVFAVALGIMRLVIALSMQPTILSCLLSPLGFHYFPIHLCIERPLTNLMIASGFY